jgi:hypothetical protein
MSSEQLFILHLYNLNMRPIRCLVTLGDAAPHARWNGDLGFVCPQSGPAATGYQELFTRLCNCQVVRLIFF